MRPVNVGDIDYSELASLSERHGIPFSTLCKRAESGKPLITITPADSQWVGYKEAARIFHVQSQTLYCAFSDSDSSSAYYGIRWKTRSTKNAKSVRGCGVLFRREDIELASTIRHSAGIPLVTALKVFCAMKQGKF